MCLISWGGERVGGEGANERTTYTMGLLGVPDHNLQFLCRDEGLEAGVVGIVGLLEGRVSVLPGDVFGPWEELIEELVLAAERYV